MVPRKYESELEWIVPKAGLQFSKGQNGYTAAAYYCCT